MRKVRPCGGCCGKSVLSCRNCLWIACDKSVEVDSQSVKYRKFGTFVKVMWYQWESLKIEARSSFSWTSGSYSRIKQSESISSRHVSCILDVDWDAPKVLLARCQSHCDWSSSSPINFSSLCLPSQIIIDTAHLWFSSCFNVFTNEIERFLWAERLSGTEMG